MAEQVNKEPRTTTWKQFCAVYGPRFSFMFLGLATLRIWLQCCQYDRFTSTDFGMLTVLGTLTRVLVMLAFVLLYMSHTLSRETEQKLDVISCALMTLAAGLYYVQPAFPQVPLSFVASTIGSVGMAWIATTWIRVFVRLQPGEAFLYAFLAMGVAAVVVFALGVLGASVAYILCMVMPVATVLSARNASGLLRDRPESQRHSVRDNANDQVLPHDAFGKLLGLGLINLAIGVARGYPTGLSIGIGLAGQAIHNGVVLLLAVFLIWWVLVKGHRCTMFLLAGTICAFATVGVGLIATEALVFGEAGAVLITIANSLGVAVFWCCAYDFARHSSNHPYVVFGVVWIFFLLPRELGRLIVMLMAQYLVTTSVLLIAGSLIMVVLVAGMALLLSDRFAGGSEFMFRELSAKAMPQEKPDEGKEPVQEALLEEPAEEPVDPFETLAQTYGLTPREIEILRLVAVGRSRAFIGEQLCLSANTVKGHMHNIYAKTGVHTKQQLLNLILT